MATALQVYVEGFSKRTGIAVAVTAPDLKVEVPRAVETTLLRIAQEALANVHRHSGARTATVRLSASAEALVLRIADDGRGMPIAGGDYGKMEGVGIRGMRARLRQLGGDLEIRAKSSGTLIKASVPMTSAAQRMDALGPHAPPGGD